ncbi:hypothetical protein NIES4106_02720 [Fischerella sp. NIES-4106]|nr:hypothetical protein NIES4106_02720 [Fischerella sp. NIES-4106]
MNNVETLHVTSERSVLHTTEKRYNPQRGPLVPQPSPLAATVYTQVKIFHFETVSRLELKFQAHSESPLKWTGTNFFLSPLQRTCAMRLGINSEAVLTTSVAPLIEQTSLVVLQVHQNYPVAPPYHPEEHICGEHYG